MWQAQPGPQTLAINSAGHVDELLYGGARGGGKSDFLLGDFAQDVEEYGEHWHGVLFRRTYPELEEMMARAQAIYPSMFPGAETTEGGKNWQFPGGATLRLRYLEREQDATRYQGHSYGWIGWDELGQWADDGAFKKLRATLRSAYPIPCKRIRASANPGGPGHQWVKQQFIDPAPGGYVRLADEVTGMSRMYIPARVQDNRILLANDPGYVDRLRGVGSEALVKAWLEGDWNIIEGAYFDCWSLDMIVRPFEVPQHWTRIRSFDWGSAAPFSCGWWAVASEDFIGPSGTVPKNSLVRYREWYGKIAANIGLKMTAREVAEGILEREAGDERRGPFQAVHDAVADPSIFIEDGGPSIAEEMYKAGVQWRPADNKRIPGWEQLRQRMVGAESKPAIYTFETCADSIRTIPALQHDEKKPEDLDTDAEDHAGDEWRYAAMSRPYTKVLKVDEPFDIDRTGETWDQMMKRISAGRDE